MKRILLMLVFIFLFIPISVRASENYAPPVPDSAIKYMPENTESFSEGLWDILQNAIQKIYPTIYDAACLCAAIIGVALIISLVNQFSESSSRIIEMVGCILIASVLLNATNTMIHTGMDTVKEISDYGNLLIPVMTGALAAQGGISTSVGLYTGTALFSSILSWCTSSLLRPLLYIFLSVAIIKCVATATMLEHLSNFIKWFFTWGLKISLYVFTGYMSITGAISGSTDAARLKATKITISGMVPVIGGILSDASESVLVSAGLIKNSAGIYGLLAILSICIEPFLVVGIQYLLLKITTAICQLFECKKVYDTAKSFTSVMGFILAVIGSVCLMLLVSIVCFMKVVA